MRLCPLLLCSLLLIGCSSLPPTTPDISVAPETPDPVGNPFPGEPPVDLDHPLIRNGAADISGTVTLNGSGTVPPVYDTAPFDAMISGRIDELMLVTLTPTAIPGAANNPMVQFKGATTSYGSLPYPTNGTPQYMPIYLSKNETAGVVLHNSAAVGGSLYAEAAKYVGSVKTIPKEDGGEPNDDGDVATYTDRTMANTLPVGSTFNRTLYRKTAVTNEDREDWFKLTLAGSKKYRISLINSNGTWGSWAYDLRLLTSAGTVIASRLGVTGTSTTIDITTTTGGTFYLQVAGNPLSRRGASVYYTAFSLNCKELKVPAISAVTPSGGVIGTVDQRLTFSATASESPTSWSWTFDGGVTPSTSTAAAPQVELFRQGTFTGNVVATNAIGSSTQFNFTYIVGSPVVGWTSYALGPSWEGGEDTSIQTWNDTIAIAHRDHDFNLKFTYSPVPNPGAHNWTTHEVLTDAPYLSMTYNIVTSRYVIASTDLTETDLRISTATVSAPDDASDWSTYSFLTTDSDGFYPDFCNTGSRIALLYYNNTEGRYEFTRGFSGDPSHAGDWVFSTPMGSATGVDGHVTFSNGRFFIVASRLSEDGFLYAYSNNDTPITSTWNASVVELHDGRPVSDLSITPSEMGIAVAYFVPELGDLFMAMSTITAFSSPAILVDTDCFAAEGRGTSLIKMGGRLTVAYSRSVGGVSNMRVARALDGDPLGPSDFIYSTVEQDNETGWYTSVGALNSRLIYASTGGGLGNTTLRINLAQHYY